MHSTFHRSVAVVAVCETERLHVGDADRSWFVQFGGWTLLPLAVWSTKFDAVDDVPPGSSLQVSIEYASRT